MIRTMVRPSIRHLVPGGSEGYTPGPDGFMQIGDLGGAMGAGTIYTTVGDLQTWVENYAHPRVGTATGIKEMMTSYVLADGKKTGYGYGLFIDEQRGLRRVHHGGADVERHYRGWVDEPIPALGGRTPRHAARLKTIRPRVIELLKDLENGMARERAAGRPAIDLDWLWTELGLRPISNR